MEAITRFYGSTIGKKFVVAGTGIVLFLFVVGHMIGNLKTFAGIDPESGLYKLDVYAHFLREIGHQMFGHGGFLWLVRIVLVACVLAHVVTVIQLRRLNNASKPVKYKVDGYQASTYAARTMWWGGLIIAAFIVFHILHFTTGHLHFQGFEHGAVYANVYKGFQVWYTVVIYLVALLALTFHLYHGVWSLFQTLGLEGPKRNRAIRLLAQVSAVVLFLGFISVPVAAFAGLMKAPVSQVEAK